MSPEREQVRKCWPFDTAPHRVVVKVGSNVLAPGGRTESLAENIERLVRDCAAVGVQGTEVILVTSGAVAAGMGVLGVGARPTDLAQLQALAAVGQGRLMALYAEAFERHGRRAGQLLLTREGLEDRTRYLNAQYTIEALLGMGVVPVINENDSVATDELTFGDNDVLSAFTAGTVDADLLVLLTDTDGLYSGNPGTDPGARLLPVVHEVTDDVAALADGPGSGVGKGGMASKVAAARHAAHFGIATVIASGRADGMLARVMTGHFRGTLFLSRGTAGRRGKARTHWISTRRARGRLVVDDGARRALEEQGRSLLPVGIVGVEGSFGRGDVVAVVDQSGRELARGISNYATADLEALRGRRVGDRDEPPPPYAEAIHRNNLFLRR